MLHTGAGQPGQRGGERSQWGDGGAATRWGQASISAEEQQRDLKHGSMKLSSSSRGLEGEAARGTAMGLARTRREPGDEWVGVRLPVYRAEEKKNAWKKGNGQRTKFSFLRGKCRLVKLNLPFL